MTIVSRYHNDYSFSFCTDLELRYDIGGGSMKFLMLVALFCATGFAATEKIVTVSRAVATCYITPMQVVDGGFQDLEAQAEHECGAPVILKDLSAKAGGVASCGGLKIVAHFRCPIDSDN